MTDTTIAAFVTAGAPLIVAFASVGIGLWNRRETDINARDIQEIKGAENRDLERLRTKLNHGQLVSSTQWNAEFKSYQAIWKEMVKVRPLADKLVNREGELHRINLSDEYLSSNNRLKFRKELVEQLAGAAMGLLSAIHENAPFYPASIRTTANEAHKAAISLVMSNLAVLTQAMLGTNLIDTEEFRAETQQILLKLIQESDHVEGLIRGRLEAVQVINHMLV